MAGLHFTDISNQKIGSITGCKTESLVELMQLPCKVGNSGVQRFPQGSALLL
jgi:hypothetical protein